MGAVWARIKGHPTLVIQAISAVLAWLVTYQLPGLSAGQAAAVIVVLSAILGAYNAWRVRPVAPAVWQALVTTGTALLSAYGLHFSQQQVGALQLAVVSVMALLTWQSVSPVEGRSTDVDVADPAPADDPAAYAAGRAPVVGDTPRRVAY